MKNQMAEIESSMIDVQNKMMWNKLCNIKDQMDRIEHKLDLILESGDINGNEKKEHNG